MFSVYTSKDPVNMERGAYGALRSCLLPTGRLGTNLRMGGAATASLSDVARSDAFYL